MENNNNSFDIEKSSDRGNPILPKLSKKSLPLPLVWIISTFIICAVFILVSIPKAQAQSRQQVPAGGQQQTSIIRNVFEFIQQHYVDEIDSNVLFEGAMNGMFEALGDPYSAFLPATEMAELTDTTQGSFGGVGLFIHKQLRNDGRPTYIEVAAPIEDTPGWRAGINPGDLIIQINDESTELLSSDEARDRLRGQPGTPVNIIIRRGEKIEFPITLVRAIIEVPTVKHGMIDNIGYLNLLTFTPHTTDRAREAIEEFRSKGYQALILDLRNNSGGLLNTAVGVANLFIEGGVVVSTKSRIPQENSTFYARAKAIVSEDIPMVVLINRGSASASEIVAGALKDRGRAYLVGEKSFGKGSVQQVYPLSNVGFKLTTARYYTPSDVNIDKIGIPPDREVLFPEFSDAEAEHLNALLNTTRIRDFVNNNPHPSSREIETFVLDLKSNFDLELSLLKRLVRNELNRTIIAPVYDMEYDVQLQEAVKILKDRNFWNLMRGAKTLKTLQEEAIQNEDFHLAS